MVTQLRTTPSVSAAAMALHSIDTAGAWTGGTYRTNTSPVESDSFTVKVTDDDGHDETHTHTTHTPHTVTHTHTHTHVMQLSDVNINEDDPIQPSTG